ncbi:hypothetical protein VNO77_04506 [Canavalia gladiata]|uniref:Uncharacterized protein n=1 Tax=Canavalia gladiata TaxID=3824 RepID=A0AAN9MWM2_CANGL
MEYTEDMDEWQQIQQQHQSLETSGWNMVVINQNYLQVEVQGDQSSSTNQNYPPSPTHHQGSLQIVPTTITEPQHGISSPSPASNSMSEEEEMPPPPASAASGWRVRVANEGKKLLKLRLGAMRDRVAGVVSKVSNWTMCAGAFWSFTYVNGAAVAVVVVLVSLVYVGIRRRRRGRIGRKSVVDHWGYLLREKDEKISQLSLQIAQLNEVLSARRKVLVHRINH